MTEPRSELKSVPASLHARLLAFAKKEDRDFNQVLTQYFQERLLDRLARSRYDEQFALKGALPFVALDEGSAAVRGRPTKDIDFEALDLHPKPEANSRMKDFRDLYVLAVTTPFDGAVITEAVRRTFERRGTSLSSGSTVMTEGFARDADRQSAWAGYLRKERIDTVPGSFEAVMPVILDFVGPPFRAAGEGSSFGRHWDQESRSWR